MPPRAVRSPGIWIATAVCLAAAIGASAVLVVRSAGGVGSKPIPGRVLWRADGTRPIQDEWASYATGDVCWTTGSPLTAPGRASSRAFVTRVAGRTAYAFHLVDGDDCSGERAELAQGNPTKPASGDRQFHRGDDVWIAYEFLIPADAMPVVPTWQCLGQLKAAGRGGPVVCPDLVDDRLGLRHTASTVQGSVDLDRLWQAPRPVVRGRWIRYVFHVDFDPDPQRGSLEFWADLADGGGMQRRVARRSLSTMKVGADGRPLPVHARIGVYRDPATRGDARIFYAGYTVATTRAAAEHAAFGATP